MRLKFDLLEQKLGQLEPQISLPESGRIYVVRSGGSRPHEAPTSMAAATNANNFSSNNIVLS